VATVKNWKEFQHYKNRCPPWIKLQKSLLDDYGFACLPLASKALAPCIWLIASEDLAGNFDPNPYSIAWRLRWPVRDVAIGMISLIEQGFVDDASNVLATCKQLAIPEAEAEAEKSKSPPEAAIDFKAQIFAAWKALPGGGGAAFLQKLLRENQPEQRVLEAVEMTLASTRADPKAYVTGILRREAKAEAAYDDVMKEAV